MFKTDVDPIEILNGWLAGLPHLLETYAWALLAFAIIAGLSFVISNGRERRISAREVAGHVFPGSLLRQPSSRVDLLHTLLQFGLWEPLIALVGAVIVGVSTRELLTAGFGNREPLLQGTWSIASLQFAALLLTEEFGSYVSHYCLHRIPWLWSLHRGHHSAEALTFLTFNRGHPLDALISRFLTAAVAGVGTGVALYFLGTPLMAMAITALGAFYGALFPLLGFLHHSHIRISFGWLNRVFQSPAMHQLHHSAELRHRDKNLGGALMIYDWMFGTLYVPRPGESYRLGLNEAELGPNNPHNRLLDFYLEPLRHAWRTLLKGKKRPAPVALNTPRS